MHGGMDVWAAVAAFDRGTVTEDEARADAEREQVLAQFPLEDWPALPWNATPSEWTCPLHKHRERGTAA
ncbi:hypothetical protein [Streptomyces sp. Tu 3180]|uniref:hypothetical protein n=1 Tax=Streptomyces sp. Tu 3180 TaxID=2682611 RepID=UPI001FB722D1|nr:hypothetical protein [Streptomyces sp. Tu 3180]